MATTTEPPVSDSKQHYVDFDEYVDFYLARTRSGIKFTEILTTLGWIATLGLSYLLVFTVFDHWVMEGGFSPAARFWLLIGIVGVTVSWLGWKVVYPYLRRINVLYAARQIERAAPALKGGLLNLVDLQHAQKEIPAHVLAAIEKRAAVELSQIDVDQAVDRRPLMRISYLLLAVVVMCCLYTLLSPKDILTSVKRAMLPTSNTASPTQTRITDVEPGHVSVAARSSVPVRAKITGRVPDAVTLYFSTPDGKYADEPIVMQREKEGLPTFGATLSGENARGLLQDVTYRIEAGDASTEDFLISVVQPPSAKVESIAYEFPSYMRLEDRTENTGHIDGWEGTRVILNAVTNIPVKSATILFVEEDQPTGEEIRMRVTDGDRLSADWKLEIRADGTFAPHYWIGCQTEDGRTDPNPTRYNVVIKPDLAPQVTMLAPQRDLKIPANGTIPIRYQAADPDFWLRSLKLIVAKDGSRIVEESLVEEDRLGRAVRGVYDWRLEPLHLAVGTRLQFWLEAKDNRTPRANTKVTHRLNVEIIEAVSEKEAKEQLQQEKKRQEEQIEESADQKPEDQKPEDQKPEDQKPEDQDPSDQGDHKEDRGNASGTKEGKPSKQKGEEGKTTDPSQAEPGEGEQGEGPGDSPGKSEQPSNKPGGEGDQPAKEKLDPESKEDQQKALEEILKHEQNKQKPQEAADEGKPKQNQKDQDSPSESSPESQDSGESDKKPGEGESEKQSEGEQSGKGKQNGGKQQGDKQPGGNQGDNQGDKGSDSNAGDKNKPGEHGSKKDVSRDGGKKPAQQKGTGGDKPSDKSSDKPSDSNAPDQKEKTEDSKSQETPTAGDPKAEKKPATGDEEGTGKAGDDKDAAKAKKQIDREGEKNDAGRTPGDPNAKPQAKEKGDPAKPPAKPKPGESNKQKPDGKSGEKKDQSDSQGKAKPGEQPKDGGDPPQQKGEEDQHSGKSNGGDKGDGDKNKAGDKAGDKGGKEPGAGGKAKGEPGGKPGKGTQADPDGEPAEGQEAKGKEGSGDPQSSGKSGGGGAEAADQSGENVAGGAGDANGKKKNQGSGSSSSAPAAEETEFDHAKKATNLVLDRLKDQLERGEVDQDLLEKLGWTEEELRKFTNRIQKQLHETGQDHSPAAIARRRQFEEMLKDLHAKPAARRRGGAKARQKRVNQFETKGHAPVPQRFRSRYRAYTQSFPGIQKSRPVKKPPKSK